MAITPKILGQAKPAALTTVTLFTVTSSNTVEFSIYINNQSKLYDGYSIALVPNGSAQTAASQLAFNTQLDGGTTTAFSGLYLNSGDRVLVSSTFGNCSFTATGIDFSP